MRPAGCAWRGAPQGFFCSHIPLVPPLIRLSAWDTGAATHFAGHSRKKHSQILPRYTSSVIIAMPPVFATRDMAGPLSALDMESQFKPAPFGNPAKPSPLVQVMAPENAALWDNFRNIEPEKEARVIQVSIHIARGLRPIGWANARLHTSHT